MIAMDYSELNLNTEMESRRRAGSASPFLMAFVTSRPGFGLASYSSLAGLSVLASYSSLDGLSVLASYSSLDGLSGWPVAALWLALPAGQLQLSGWPFRLASCSSLDSLSGWPVTALWLVFPTVLLQPTGRPAAALWLASYSFLADQLQLCGLPVTAFWPGHLHFSGCLDTVVWLASYSFLSVQLQLSG